MKKKYLALLQCLLFMGVCCYAQKIAFNSKYIKVGVISNEWPTCMAYNPNLRNLGTLPSSIIDENSIGKQVLDRLFLRDEKGLHMDLLYEQALQNTTIEELEVALKDISAETKDILKREVAHQLMKNNYVVTFRTEPQKINGNIVGEKKYWAVYHVEIDDRIIEQAYLNWRNPEVYDQIRVPVKLVATGKVPKRPRDENELIYKIAKKVPAFAVRGPVTERFPFTARMGSDMAIKKTSRIFVYRIKENNNGDIYSKKVCTTRATEVTNNSTRMFMISGNFPSTKKGDIAVLKDRHRSSLSLMGQASFGDDSRCGGRLQYEQLLGFSKSGIAQYFLFSVGYNRHEKEPKGIWWDDSKSIQPILNNANISIGYGIGFNFGGRFELMPYVMGGYQYSFVTGAETMIYWDKDYQLTDNSSKGLWRDLKLPDSGQQSGLHFHSFITHGGVRLSTNLWYPLQVVVGADYNFTTKNKRFAPLIERHTIDRVNIYAGLRFHF